ncbi:MAG: hypothetical protein J7647_29055 [Cyanobacteria bacterium SBLK]|nr:hypothetical protein [Cyanobacteria bacterium SBLK]
MQKITNRIAQWFALFAMVLTFATAFTLSANAAMVFPGGKLEGPPICPQIEVSAQPYCNTSDETGEYAIYSAASPQPLTDRNFVPCSPPYAMDSYYPPNAEQVIIINRGRIPLNVQFVCD